MLLSKRTKHAFIFGLGVSVIAHWHVRVIVQGLIHAFIQLHGAGLADIENVQPRIINIRPALFILLIDSAAEVLKLRTTELRARDV